MTQAEKQIADDLCSAIFQAMLVEAK